MSAIAPGHSIKASVRLHNLTMVDEDDAVMVGRPDIGSYALFPKEGAQALRMLDAGSPVSTVAEWYEQTSDDPLDVDDFLVTLKDLQFVRAEGEDKAGIAPLRWQRLGRWALSWPAWSCYLVLTSAAMVAMAHNPSLRPSYQHLFFTHYLSLIPIALAVTQLPCVIIHEAFHALAGRRLGLPSVLRISRRLFYVVAETRLDSLLSVPRRQRYLPFLAGMLADVLDRSRTGQRALRRCDPRLVTVMAEVKDGWSGRFGEALASYTSRVTWQPRGHPPVPADADPAQLFIDSDGTSKDPVLHQAYLDLPAEERARRHTARAETLAALGDPTLRIGAIPYHLEHGTDPAGAGVEAMLAAGDDCFDRGFTREPRTSSCAHAGSFHWPSNPRTTCTSPTGSEPARLTCSGAMKPSATSPNSAGTPLIRART